uniref:Uncharacterized protein n=1 Tax=Romanomermis culicivorax TaxID=13658 RepID=A0A915JF24_ROMCU
MTYCQHDDFAEVMGKTNPIIVAYTAAQARLKQHYLLVVDKQQYHVPIGWCLCEMTDELCEYGPGSYITEFISGGPKNYAYRMYAPSTKQYHDAIK